MSTTRLLLLALVVGVLYHYGKLHGLAENRLLLLALVLGLLYHYGKLYALRALVFSLWARHKLLTVIGGWIVLYFFQPTLAVSLLLPVAAIIGVAYMLRTR